MPDKSSASNHRQSSMGVGGHRLFTNRSAGRTITVTVAGDHGGYAKNHGKNFGDTGTITYARGVVTYT